MIALKCPACGADLSVDDNLQQCFCQYCGTKIQVADCTTTHTYRTVDEARIKEAEVREQIRLEELELEERKEAARERRKGLKIKATIILGILSAVFIVVGNIGREVIEDPNSSIKNLSTIGVLCLIPIFFIWRRNDKTNGEGK